MGQRVRERENEREAHKTRLMYLSKYCDNFSVKTDGKGKRVRERERKLAAGVRCSKIYRREGARKTQGRRERES